MELIIVIIILGILAALAIPQFSGSTRDAQISTMKADMALVQKAIQRYQVEHDQRFPDTNIADQLTQYSKVNGQSSPNKAPQYKFGPYLVKFPANPLASGSIDADGVNVVDDAGPLTADASPTTGWKYSYVTGEFISNVPAN